MITYTQIVSMMMPNGLLALQPWQNRRGDYNPCGNEECSKPTICICTMFLLKIQILQNLKLTKIFTQVNKKNSPQSSPNNWGESPNQL